VPENQPPRDNKGPVQDAPCDYQDMLMNAPIGIFTSTPEGRFVYANKALAQIFGYDSPGELIEATEDIGTQLYADTADRDEILRLVGESDDRLNHECRFVRRDGFQFWGSYSVRAVRGQTGDVTYYQGFLTDITGRKQERESLLRTQFAMDRAPDSILWVDDEGRIIYANDAACASMGYTREELLTMTAFDIDPDFPLEKWEEHKEEVQRRGSMTFESRHRTKDGRLFPVEVSTNHFKFDERYLACAFDRDITERKRAEAEREKLQGQLLQSQKLEAIGILAGGVAHDFNNMLGAITGYAELTLNKMGPTDPFRKNLEKILDAGRRSANLTRQLLAFARKQTIEPILLDLNEAVGAILKMIRRLIGENVELTWLPGADPCTVKMDPSQLDQILINLCVNARDAMGEVGRVTIETAIVSLDEACREAHSYFVPGEYVLLAVSDDGCGMDRETLDHIFEPFFTTKGLGRGTGMGLATVYGIVKQNQGFINVYSEPGKGTTFRIYIPQHAGGVMETKAAVPEDIPLSRGESILIVEDDPTLLEMSTMLLQQLGYTVIPAATPNDAIRIAQQTHPEIHLLITDVIMPEMNGRDLADRLLAIRPKMKLLFMSGYTANVIAHQGVLDKGVNFIQKPFSVKDIAARVREVLG